MKIGIAIEDWKLPIFKRHLKQSGYQYYVVEGATEDTLFLSVETLNMEALEKVIRAANDEAKRTGTLQ